MKNIKLIDGEIFKSKAIIKQIMETSPQAPLSIVEMRTRCKILDALAALAPEDAVLILEDADWEVLKKADSTFPYQVAHKELLEVRNAIEKGE